MFKVRPPASDSDRRAIGTCRVGWVTPCTGLSLPVVVAAGSSGRCSSDGPQAPMGAKSVGTRRGDLKRTQTTTGRSREQVRGSIVVSISACLAEGPGSIPGRGAACTDRAHHNGQLLMQPGLGQRVPCFWVCPPSSAFLGRRRWPQNRTKGQRARAERDGPRLAQICRSRLSWSLGPRAAVSLMISRRAEPLRSGAATSGTGPR